MQTFSRSHGSSAPSLAAYRAGERIRDERARRTHDHTDRQGVMHKEIMLPARSAGAAASWATDRATLWNAAETAEKRKDARVAREYLIAVPSELTHPQRVHLVRGFAQELAERYGFAVDVALHSPRDFRGSDPRNFHAHLLATTREVSREGLGRKTTLDLRDENRRQLGLGPAVRELFYVRQRWAEVANVALESAHIDARIDHRSLAAQGITRAPKLWIPRVPYEIERRGGHSVVAERIREEHRARLGPPPSRLEPLTAAPETRNLERDRNPARSDDIARQSVENWRQYRLEKLMSGELEPTAKESAEKWLKYRRDVLEHGKARAAERHMDRVPAAGHDRDYDFGL
jgi:ATP-dependent exoDNAse (exonuclease V) alpha subunit